MLCASIYFFFFALPRFIERIRITGSHHIYTKEDVVAILSIPVHSNRDLPIGTLKSIMKDAGLTEEDLG
ncbi:MAG: type II toxin-antitoxin system HicA family toxin [Nostoc sp.]